MARRRPPEAPGLFDLPLDPTADGAAALPPPPPEPPAGDVAGAGETSTSTVPEPAPGGDRGAAGVPAPGGDRGAAGPPGPSPAVDPPPAGLAERLRAGLADLAMHAVVALGLLVGAELMGARPGLGEVPAVALFLLVFSFLYAVVPLSFWGRTPGMRWTGLAVRAEGGLGLTVGQTVRRWLGSVLTAALLGLPALLALTGRSLADRLSGSRTVRVPARHQN